MKNKCPNCGAPIDIDKNVCPYCDSKFEEAKQPEKVEAIESKHEKSYDDEMDGCLRAIITLGLISFFTGGHHGPRPPRFPRH